MNDNTETTRVHIMPDKDTGGNLSSAHPVWDDISQIDQITGKGHKS